MAAGIVYRPKRYKSSATGKLVYGPDGEPLEDITEIEGAIRCGTSCGSRR